MLAWFAWHAFGSRSLVADGIEERTCSLQLQLVDSQTGNAIPGMVGLRIFKRDVAKELLAEMQRNRNFVAGRGQFANEAERDRVLEVYDQAISHLTERIGR